MARTYRRRSFRKRSAGALRRRRYAKRYRRSGKSRSIGRSRLRSVRPEVKFVTMAFPFDPTTGGPATTFIDTLPGSSFGSIDVSPGQGVTSTSRVGDHIMRIGYKFDMYFECTDQNVDWCCCIFKWKQTPNIDGGTWPNPIASSGTSAGELINPWFPPGKNQWIQPLYYRRGRSRVTAVAGGAGSGSNVYRYHLKYFRRKREQVSFVDSSTSYPTNMGSAAMIENTSWKNRIYWCFITNNLINADCQVFGRVTQYFTDA